MNSHSAWSSKLRVVGVCFGLTLILVAAVGCGDSTSRMAGTLDFPDRDTARPDMKKAAVDAKAKAKAAKAAR